MKKLPRDATIEARWSDLGNPTTPGEYRPSALGGNRIEIHDVDIATANAHGGDPRVRLINSIGAQATENFWVVSKFVDE